MLTEPPEAVPASRGGVVTALLLLVAVGAVTLLTLRPPAPEPAEAPAGTFSAARAMETVTAIPGSRGRWAARPATPSATCSSTASAPRASMRG